MKKRIDIDEVLRKHSARIEREINEFDMQGSREYATFKAEMIPELTRYEKFCKSLGNLIKINVSKKDEERIRKKIEVAHLDVQPSQALTLGIMVFISVFFIGLLISIAVALVFGSLESFPTLFFFLVIIFSVFLFYFVNGYPERLANKWRLKASSQMVPAILYIVVYMRHTSNLERAIAFASGHLQPPLALDFKKIFYDVEIGKFSTIKESLDNYLEFWRDSSVEFIEAFHLIESSLFEPDESRRIATLEKSLQVVLDGVYDKMLLFTHNVRSPLTNVYMLGVVLPTLGLALLPLASAMIGGMLLWHHVLIIFNLIIPFFVFYLTNQIMLMRPGGYGEKEFLERSPLYYKFKNKGVYVNAFLMCLPFFILGFLPLIFQYTSVPEVFGLEKDYSFSQLGLSVLGNEKIFGFMQSGNGIAGPFGIGALFLSMFIPLGLALFFSISFGDRTDELIKERSRTKQLENEFNNSLFQLGNRLGNGVPPELVFGRVAESSKGLMTEDFFKRVDYNIRQMGMSAERAIFDKRRGSIIFYPSELIATSMKILVESSKKGLQIAAVSLMSISEYLKNIQKINQRLNDMLAEIVSDMKSNMGFLAPLLSGIVVGLAMMITSILNKINIPEMEGGALSGVDIQTILKIFDISKMIPPYYLQIIVGIYLVEVTFILTSTLVTINSGEDRLEETSKTGKNLQRGAFLYFMTVLVSTLALYLLTSIVLGNLAS